MNSELNTNESTEIQNLGVEIPNLEEMVAKSEGLTK